LILVGRARDFLSILKTIIFCDGIDGGQRIAAALQSEINSELASTCHPQIIVQMFYGTVDEPKKKRILSDLVSGTCQIVICTDAFGLGVDISDIKWVVQWGIDKKVSASKFPQQTPTDHFQVLISGLTQ